ncbi:hypothetical protein [Gordonia humi]|uniref:Uncharacterized protein n=1 Tax=Gordonia humi TaxID=686429 RepID=A0A840F853_9ACTN|nr:hypothetical protein [Gordonia humi]MBB4138066.1 hypothetical protein [Gordonia humi]
MYRRPHLAHLNTHRDGLRVPLLFADSHTAPDRSPAITLDTDRHGQLITTSHPYRDDRTILRVLLDGAPCWISDRWIAHRSCQECIDVWQQLGTEYYNAAIDASLYLATHLDVGHYRGETLVLHPADELSDKLDQAV